MVLSVDASYEGEETFSLVETIRHIAQSYYPDTWYLAGEGVSTYDLMDTVTADMVKVNLAAIAAVFIVLLLTMKSGYFTCHSGVEYRNGNLVESVVSIFYGSDHFLYRIPDYQFDSVGRDR